MSCCDQGILDQAASQAKTQIEALLQALDFTSMTAISLAGVYPADERSL